MRRPEPGRRSIFVHSHPSGDAWASAADMAWSRFRPGRSPFAIYSVARHELRIRSVLGQQGYASVELVVEP
jgi:proteasome lid subunit RPN8/RPN11